MGAAVTDRALPGGVSRRSTPAVGRRRDPVRQVIDRLVVIGTQLVVIAFVAIRINGIKW
jgi:hypothetical protein